MMTDARKQNASRSVLMVVGHKKDYQRVIKFNPNKTEIWWRLPNNQSLWKRIRPRIRPVRSRPRHKHSPEGGTCIDRRSHV